MGNQPLSEKLRLLRDTKGYTQQMVADRLQISRQTYQHYESGRSMPDTTTLYRLSVIFQVPVLDLMSVDATISRAELLNDSPQYRTGSKDLLASLIRKLRQMTPEQQQRVLQYVNHLLGEK